MKLIHLFEKKYSIYNKFEEKSLNKDLKTSLIETCIENNISLDELYSIIVESKLSKKEKFIKASKGEFKKQYGENWKKVLYSTANKKFKNLNENYLVGCWITDTGEIIDVDHSKKIEHSTIAYKYFTNKNNDSIDNIYEKAFNNGWIRVSIFTNKTLTIEFILNKLNKQSKIKLLNYLKNNDNFKEYMVSHFDNIHNYKLFNNYKEFILHLRKIFI